MPLLPRLTSRSTGLLHLPVLLIALLLSSGIMAQADKATYATGEKVFKENCAACHKPDKDMTGPMLKGAKALWDGKGDVHLWVKNSQAYIQSGNAYAKQLFEDHNKIVMPPQSLTNDQIDAVLYFADNYAPPASAKPQAATPTEAAPSSNWEWWVIVGLVLLVVLLSLSGVRYQLTNAVREKEGLAPQEPYGTWRRIGHWAGRNKGWASVVGFIILVWVLILCWNFLLRIGVYGGEKVAHYKPTQPIKFDHTLHAGKDNLAINCEYCHSGAEKSKHAGIPSANVCMNCHKAISEGAKTGTVEIAKIYEAVGWDPKTNTYTGHEKPLVWNKVHNLPDLAFFSHEQHVAVGKIECQKCHGPVDTKMDQVEQWSPLTMGWCIDCHNKTEVKVVDSKNGYYKEIYRRLATTPMGQKELRKYLEDDKITVRELGGWECAKCHY